MMILTQTKYYKYKPFLTSMKGGESDTTRPSLAIMPILVMTIVLLFPHGKKKCDEVGQSLKLLEYQLCLDLNSKQ